MSNDDLHFYVDTFDTVEDLAMTTYEMWTHPDSSINSIALDDRLEDKK